MPDLTGPLFSIAASGTIGRTATYQRHRRTQTVRAKPPGTPATSQAQLDSQRLMAWLNIFWRQSQGAIQQSWAAVAKGRGASGYNRFLSSNLGAMLPQPNLSTLVPASPASPGLPMTGGVMFFIANRWRIRGSLPKVPDGWTFLQRVGIFCLNLDWHTTDPTAVTLAASASFDTDLIFNNTNYPGPVWASQWMLWLTPQGATVYSPSITATHL